MSTTETLGTDKSVVGNDKEGYFKQQFPATMLMEKEEREEKKRTIQKVDTKEVDVKKEVDIKKEVVLKNRKQHEKLLPAFPGAEGGGAASQGGRGGKVYVVTNLNNAGEGSLRYGLEELKGARTIVFRVGGYIHLKKAIVVSDDAFITIAGQTAPGDGITVTTVTSVDEVFLFRRCHDLILRYIRIRKGGQKSKGQQGSSLVFAQSGKNIMVDHCSISWSGDDNLEIAVWKPKSLKKGLQNISIQYTILSEGLSHGHAATGIIAGGSNNIEKMTDISVHHNLFANSQNRDPLMKVASGDVVSNLIYNWSWWATGISGGMVVDIINNKYKAGPNLKRKGRNRGEIVLKDYDPTHKIPGATGLKRKASVFLEGNIGPHNSDSRRDAWDLMVEKVNKNWSYFSKNGKPSKTIAPRSYQRKTRRALKFPISETPASQLEDILLRRGGVGASRRLSAKGFWIENHDLVDRRVIKEYKSGEGTKLMNVDSVGGWPVYLGDNRYKYVSEKSFIKNLKKYHLKKGIAYRDSDRDGMSDIWEDKHGFNKNDKRDAIADRDGDGYDNLEEFLNGTRP
jgi:pectate lyase